MLQLRYFINYERRRLKELTMLNALRTGFHHGVVSRAMAVLFVCAFLAACEHTQNRPTPPAQASSAESGEGLNQSWGSCEFRRCGYSK